MKKNRLVVLISGNGSNLQAIIDSCGNDVIPNTEIVGVISNKQDAKGIDRAKQVDIPTFVVPLHKGEKRTEYDARLAVLVKNLTPSLIVLAGWMRILTKNFLGEFNDGQVINLHPALPGQFPGADGIGDAFKAFLRGEITETGLMVHEVVEQIDAGRVLVTEKISIEPTDTLDTLREKVQSREKYAIVTAIYNKLFKSCGGASTLSPPKIYQGKVRNMHDIGYGVVAMEHSDRLSAFDRQICTVPGKGKLLLNISKWWFQRTKCVIENHYIHDNDNVMFVRKCKPIPLEIVVRGYITGATKTSMWTHYNDGDREYCGHLLPEGLKKNQKLSTPLVTPTTKGATDELISEEQIIDRKILSQSDWTTIKNAALELFNIGQYYAEQQGLILADTKYEFGWHNGKIILMDELHTPDSSRYWIAKTYQQRFDNDQEPQKIDKDFVRDYLKLELQWNPYDENSNVPDIPPELIENTFQSYYEVYFRLMYNQTERHLLHLSHYFRKSYQPFDTTVEHYWLNTHSPVVVMVCANNHQFNRFKYEAIKLGVENGLFVLFEHGGGDDVLSFLKKYQNRNVVWITPESYTAVSMTKNTHNPVVYFAESPEDAVLEVFDEQNAPVMTVINIENAFQSAKRLLLCHCK